MKKSSFVAMVLGTVSGVLFALGHVHGSHLRNGTLFCRVSFSVVSVCLLGLITLIVWRKMEHKAPHPYILAKPVSDRCCRRGRSILALWRWDVLSAWCGKI